jgi:hypothetical protein
MRTDSTLLRGIMITTGAVVCVLVAGCTPSGRPKVVEEDLSPYERLAHYLTSDYYFRRSVGGDDLVSDQSSIIQRPSHEERLLIRATLYADTLVQAELEQLCDRDTLTPCDSVRNRYHRAHQWPDLFRITVRVNAKLSSPFALKPLKIYLTDDNDIDYEPAKTVLSRPMFTQRKYVDREVRRYDPYTESEYQVYNYRKGYEYRSQGKATLYFRRRNIIGTDLLADPATKLRLTFRSKRMNIGTLEWDLVGIREKIKMSSTLGPSDVRPARKKKTSTPLY